MIVFVIIAMVVVGLIIAGIAGMIWKQSRPIGVKGDVIVGVATAVVIGVVVWYATPAMGFSDTWKWFGLSIEPALGALLVLWLIRTTGSQSASHG